MSDLGAPLPPTVMCPTCRSATPYVHTNPWRPFCSARCRNADLGAWATERYRVVASPPDDDDDLDEPVNTAAH